MSKWSMLRRSLGKLTRDEKLNPKQEQNVIESEVVETSTEAVNEAFKISVNISKLSRSLDEARTRYQLHEKKALTKPTGFYETKLETLTDIIISYERTQQEKSRRLHQLQQSMTPEETAELNDLLKRNSTVSVCISTRTSKSTPDNKRLSEQLTMKSSAITKNGSIIAACE